MDVAIFINRDGDPGGSVDLPLAYGSVRSPFPTVRRILDPRWNGGRSAVVSVDDEIGRSVCPLTPLATEAPLDRNPVANLAKYSSSDRAMPNDDYGTAVGHTVSDLPQQILRGPLVLEEEGLAQHDLTQVRNAERIISKAVG
jgi:hypothetical protein